MSASKDRRAARILREIPLVLSGDDGQPLDAHATAHDLSVKGFKIESRAELGRGQFVRFALSLDAEDSVKGRARIVWVERTDLSWWAGAEFLKISARDRRRVRRITNPSAMDWDALADKAIFALSVLLATAIVWGLLSSTLWRGLIGRLLPAALAALAMGWALRVLLRRR